MDGVFKSNLQELYRYMIQNINALEVGSGKWKWAMILMGLVNSKADLYILEENVELNEDVIKGYEFVMNNRKKRDK